MSTRVFRLTVLCLLVPCLLVPFFGMNGEGYVWPKPHTYSTRWDKVNIDDILASTRLMQYYFNCLMSRGPCPPDGQALKRILPEALETACAKCTKSQIEGAAKVIRYLREFDTVKWESLAARWDPDGTYRKRYLEPPPDNNVA